VGDNSKARGLTVMKALLCGIRLAIGLSAACLVGLAGAQESLEQGKNPAQLFASDCSICHKSPQGLARAGGMFGVEGFLREHYTTGRGTAAAIANYLNSMNTRPAPARASKRTAKGDENTRADDRKRAGVKPGDTKGIEKRPDATGSEASPGPKTSEPKPAEILTPELRPGTPAANETKPADGAKSD
jgi:hypothetical protein